jgi:Secretin and TonB N terminus short domain
MIVHSQWRVRAAISVVFFFAMYLVEGQSLSKDSFQKKVSIKGQNVSFEQVLYQLSGQTKLYFIYSSNSIELNKSLTLKVDQSPLHEVLDQLAGTMNVTFRREGNYVVVKPATEVKHFDQPEKTFLIQKLQPIAKSATQMAVVTVDEQPKQYSEIDGRLFIPDHLLKKNLLNCTPEFSGIDTSYVQKHFPLKITTPRSGRLLFASFGLIVNEYSGGAEVRVGIPALYGVANAGVMREGYLRYGYGFGTSIPIKPGVSLNPIYTLATLNRRQDYVLDENINLVMPDGLKFKGKHHQMKFLFQVQLSKRITLHGGPTINLLKASHVYNKGPIFFTHVITSYVPASNYYYEPPTQVRIVRSVYYLPPPDYSTLKSWVGVEGGISYSIKFPGR